MDQFMVSSAYVANLLIPVIVCFLLVFLIIFIYRLTVIVKRLEKTIDKAEHSLDLVDKSMEKLQTPLNTVVKLSETVDKVHDAGVVAFKQSRDYINKNSKVIKEKISSVMSFKKKKDNSKTMADIHDEINENKEV